MKTSRCQFFLTTVLSPVLLLSQADVQGFTLELFHLADQEANAAAVNDAPRLSAVLNKLRQEDVGGDGLPDNSLTLSSGDAIIPGLFYEASEAVYGSPGIADIQIQNELGVQAISFGNHEFDFGPQAIANLISGGAPGAILGADFGGANFPYLSGNLDFSTQGDLASLVVADHAAPIAGTVAATTVIDVNGELIGVVSAITPTLASISSPGSVGISPSPFGSNPSESDLDALAVVIQQDVDALLLAHPGMDKVILLSHMQQLSIEEALASRLTDVDIIVAGGSNTRLFDEDDRARDGDSSQGRYPIFTNDVDRHPVAIVNTDGSYKYLGRLVIDFDGSGNIIPASYDSAVSGAYATDEQGVTDLNAATEVDPEVQQIVHAIGAQIIATDGNFFGVTDEFLNGNRSGGPTDGVRTQETNLGNLTADANLAAAQAVDPSVVVSLKNGGGIRASIGETVVLAGGTSASRVAPSGNPLSGRPEGGISQNAIQAALAFNNGLILMTLTKAELVAALEHGVSSIPDVSGRFPQVSGVKISYDPALPAGDRLVNAAIVDAGGQVRNRLVEGGEMVGDPDEEFRIVTLDFLARSRFDENGNFVGAGDGYPFPNFNIDPEQGAVGSEFARINPVLLGQDVRGGLAMFADDGTEQDAFAEYLAVNFPNSENAFKGVDTPPFSDQRIFTEFLSEERKDGVNVLTVLSSLELPNGAEIGAFDATSNTVVVTSGAGLQVVSLDDPANPVDTTTILSAGSNITSTAVQPGSGVIAIAIVNPTDKTLPGSVEFYSASGSLLNTVPVGALPDQIVFTPDGSRLLVANEAQSADPEENDPLIFPNPEGSVSIIDLSGGVATATGVIADFKAFDSQADSLRAAGVRLFPNVSASESEVDDDDLLTVSQDLEPEAIAITNDGLTAYITLQENNAVAVLDIATATIREILPLGLKDHSLAGNAFDASNRDEPGPSRDGVINIRNWPVFGIYMPDIIKTYEVGGNTYFLTANEGDGRDVDETRGGSLKVDATAFPDPFLFDDDALGRLNFSNIDGDTDGDGDIDVLHSFGARSFSIYDSSGNQIYDSGSDFERITAELVPEIFNSSGSNPEEFDARSDDKGPEPEGLEIGTVDGQTYAFIGLERVGGIMVYNITDVNNVCFVQYLNNAGDAAPEGIIFLDESASPSGVPLLLVTNEASNTLTTYEFTPPFTLELFHLADQEASAAAVNDAPRLSAVLNKLRDEDLGEDGLPDNTLTLSSGDAIIPGLFFEASEAVYGSAGIADIQIQNELGIQAIALGNHEFDFGPRVLAELISGAATGSILGRDFTGANFPYLSGNLNFATETSLSPLIVPDHSAPVGNSLAATTVIDVNGEPVGVVAATTPTLASISSPGSVGIAPNPFGSNPGDAELAALAAEIQADVDALLAAAPEVDKVILLAHMQSLSIEEELATRLTNVDIIVAGGSNTRLFDENDRIRSGDSRQGVYPIISEDSNGEPVAIVNTDGSYKYLGRLVIDFDARGNIVPASYDPSTSGAYATDQQGVDDLMATSFTDPDVQEIADEIGAQIVATDGNFFGVTSEFLNGNRSGGPADGVRTQETNLGNLTADANLVAAREVDPTVVVSLKNGGGIRSSIGETIVLPGDTVATRRAPSGNPLSGRPEGGISQNAIQSTLAFNNGLILLTLTKAELVASLEHGVGALPGVSGRFPQVSGVRFSYDESRPIGERLVTAALVDEFGAVTDLLFSEGEIVGDPNAEIRIVTLDFLALSRFDEAGNFIGAGDGYPLPNFNTDPGTPEAPREVAPAAQVARINPVIITQSGIQTGAATFADDYSEQDALAEYLVARFPSSSPFGQLDESKSGDFRIQALSDRDDSVLEKLPLDVFTAAFGEANDSDNLSLLFEYAYGLNPGANEGTLQIDENGRVIARGGEFFELRAVENGVNFTANFLRRKDFAEQGLTYVPQFTSQSRLGIQWYDAEVTATVMGFDGEMEIVRVEFPIFTPDAEKAQFFRMLVNSETNGNFPSE